MIYNILEYYRITTNPNMKQKIEQFINKAPIDSDSLNKLKQLPESTQIYCGHEYTKSNLVFSIGVEPENSDLVLRNSEIDSLIMKNGSSLPSSIELEKKTNPFLRCDLLSDNIQLMQRFGLKNPSEKEIFRNIREWKDSA